MKKELTAAALIALLGANVALPLVAQEAPADDAAPMAGPGAGPMGGPMHEMMLEKFAEFDADGDGKVTEAEINAYRAARAASLDADGDGFVTADELTAFYMAEAQERVARRVERMMERQDTDGDGKIGAGEMMAGGPGSRMGGMMFERADADGDGGVSAEELDAFVGRMAEMREGRGERRGDGPRWGGMGHGGDHDGEGRGWFRRWR